MLIKLTGGTVYDPAHQVDGKVMDIYVRDGRIVERPRDGETISKEYDLRGKVVMAGAIDMHTHIGGGKVNIARMMLPEDHRGDPVAHSELCGAGCGHAAPSTLTTGYRYAEMGYTAGFEPALLPVNARQSHLEMGDTPIIDKGGYAMLGSDDFLLRMLAAKQDQNAINDYVAWTLHASQAIGIKVVNPGGISAFKFNQRFLDLDENNAFYQVTPREVLKVMIYLTDVTAESAPFEYLRASSSGEPIRGRPLAPLYGTSRVPASTVERHLKSGAESCMVTGPAGTMVVFDDNVVHRGNLAKEQHRDVLVLQVRPATFHPVPRVDRRWTGSFGDVDFNASPQEVTPRRKG